MIEPKWQNNNLVLLLKENLKVKNFPCVPPLFRKVIYIQIYFKNLSCTYTEHRKTAAPHTHTINYWKRMTHTHTHRIDVNDKYFIIFYSVAVCDICGGEIRFKIYIDKKWPKRYIALDVRCCLINLQGSHQWESLGWISINFANARDILYFKRVVCILTGGIIFRWANNEKKIYIVYMK